MKSIRHRILFFTLLPFLAVYGALSVFIVYQVYRLQIKEVEKELQNQAKYSASNILKILDIMELASKVSARELEKIDPKDPAARELGENIITSRFHNPGVLKVWLAFEPNAFDGSDSVHAGEYYGAPSGRYLRSYQRHGNSWIMTDDLHENSLDNLLSMPSYVIPRKTGTFYTDFGDSEVQKDSSFDTGYIFKVAEPVFRNGKPIGCVGIDAMIDEETLGEKGDDNSVSALFWADGRLCYFQNTNKAGSNLEELGFKDTDAIMNYFKNPDGKGHGSEGYSGVSGVKSFYHFHEVKTYGNTLFIYTSIPQSIIFKNIFPVLLPIGSSFIVCLAVFSILFLYFSWGIAAPLKKLSEAGESIVSGNLDMTIGVVDTKDEMGMISRSLVRMAEQFRVSKVLQERFQDQIDIILRTHYALFRNSSLEEAFNAELEIISEYYGVFKATLVFLIKESPRIVSVYPFSAREEGDSEFYAHNQVVSLLENKKLMTMNEGTLKEMEISFADYSTKSLCILPLRMNEVLRGYFILEGNKPDAMIHDDTTLIFLGNTLSYLLGSKVDWEQELTSAAAKPAAKNFFSPGAKNQESVMVGNSDEFLEKAKNIQHLNIDKGILLIGGEKDKYTELLQVTIKVISDTIIKLRRFHTGNLRAFAIEIHGIKGALFSIGAETLAEEAGQLEYAAKSDDAEYCKKNYPHLEEKLRTLSRNLAALFPQRERNSRKGNVKELAEILIKAQEACNNFDISTVNTILNPFASYEWDNEIIKDILSNIISDMDNLEYDGINSRITQLLEITRNTDQ